jgi:hypothetical protein
MTDRDAALRDVLLRITPPAPAHDDWDEIVRRATVTAPKERTKRPRRVLLTAGIAVATVAAVALFVGAPWRSGPSIVSRAQAALTVSSGTVLHLRITDTYRDNLGTVTKTPTELWISSRGRYRGFTVDPSTGAKVEIGGSHAVSSSVQYSPALNAIGPGLVTNMYYAFGDPVATLRRQLAEGKATVDGHATVNGHRATRIRLRLTGADCKPVTDYLYVDPTTYRPLEYRVVIFLPNRATLVRRFETYDHLSATPPNLRMTSLEASHPTAKVYPPTPYRSGAPSCAREPGS